MWKCRILLEMTDKCICLVGGRDWYSRKDMWSCGWWEACGSSSSHCGHGLPGCIQDCTAGKDQPDQQLQCKIAKISEYPLLHALLQVTLDYGCLSVKSSLLDLNCSKWTCHDTTELMVWHNSMTTATFCDNRETQYGKGQLTIKKRQFSHPC